MSDKSNFKALQWYSDFYNSRSDDECVICLTERQVYLIGIIIDSLGWSTRWIGDISGLDLERIAADLEYRISERMSCQNLTTILNRIVSLEQQINITQQQIEAANGGEPLPTVNTTYDDAFDTPEEQATATWSTDGCDNTDKNEWWGGISALVNYINNVNIDALQYMAQAANIPEQLERLIAGIPLLGQLPVDELLGWAGFLVTELLEEYEATVDEELLEQTVCDLFCIAVANGCTLSMRDVLDYFADKVSSGGFLGVVEDLANVMQFALIGTFSGDQYFYYMCFFQLLAATITQGFFGFRPIEYYSIRIEAGMNDPSSDWELFCLECPTYYRVESHDFRTEGLGEWTIDTWGELTDRGVEVTNQNGTTRVAQIERTVQSSWRFLGAKSYFFREGTSAGSLAWNFRVTPDTNTGGIQPTTSDCSELGQECSCTDDFGTPNWRDGFVQLRHFVSTIGNALVDDGGIQRVRIWYEIGYAPENAHLTTESPYC